MALDPLQYGTVTGRFLAAVADSTVDPDTEPDPVPLTGSIIFTPDARYIQLPNNSGGPATVVPSPITAVLDEEGYVSLNGVRGVTLIASNYPGVNPSNFTYTVTPILFLGGNQVRYTGWSTTVLAGEVTDLTLSSPVPSSTGESVSRGIGVDSARRESNTLILVLEDGSELAPVVLPPGSGVHVQTANPNMSTPGLWIETGLGTSGTDFTFWIEDGE